MPSREAVAFGLSRHSVGGAAEEPQRRRPGGYFGSQQRSVGLRLLTRGWRSGSTRVTVSPTQNEGRTLSGPVGMLIREVDVEVGIEGQYRSSEVATDRGIQ